MALPPALVRRRELRAQAIGAAEAQAVAAQRRLDVRAVVLFGSYARGDHHEASDIDVLVVVDGPLPARPQERLALTEPRPPLVQPVVWTTDEFAGRLRRGDLIATEAVQRGVWVLGTRPDLERQTPQVAAPGSTPPPVAAPGEWSVSAQERGPAGRAGRPVRRS